MNEWIKKILYIHTMGYYTALKKVGNPTIVRTLMNLEDIMLNEINQDRKTNTV